MAPEDFVDSNTVGQLELHKPLYWFRFFIPLYHVTDPPFNQKLPRITAYNEVHVLWTCVTYYPTPATN